MARKKPAPFRRPSINLDRSQQRTWKHVLASGVQIGETVASFGSVGDVEYLDDGVTKLTNYLGDVRLFPIDEVVYAFVNDDN